MQERIESSRSNGEVGIGLIVRCTEEAYAGDKRTRREVIGASTLYAARHGVVEIRDRFQACDHLYANATEKTIRLLAFRWKEVRTLVMESGDSVRGFYREIENLIEIRGRLDVDYSNSGFKLFDGSFG